MMLCPNCFEFRNIMVEMLPSKVLVPSEDLDYYYYHIRSICPQGPRVLEPDEVYLADCLKCTKCGYTDSTREQLENAEKVIKETK